MKESLAVIESSQDKGALRVLSARAVFNITSYVLTVNKNRSFYALIYDVLGIFITV